MNSFDVKILSKYNADKLNTLKNTAASGLAEKIANLPLFTNATDTTEIDSLNTLAKTLKAGLTDIIHIGVGGSSLGAQALAQLAGYGCVGHKPDVNIHFLDNLDALSLETLLNNLPKKTTGAIIISKSGTTLETIALTSVYCHWKGTEALSKSTIIITEPHNQTKNPLRQLAQKHQIPTLDHHTGIGGRFSVLSNVGLLIAALYNLDLKQIKQGAKSVIDNPQHAVEGAAYNVYFSQQGQHENILWVYMDRLKLFSAWYVQLWAESLGKNGKGLTPIAALGPVDQHSQQQLFLAGPKNKFITFITCNQSGKGNALKPDIFASDEFDYIKGRTIGDIVTAQQRATSKTLADNGIPVRKIHLKTLDATTMGALLMHFMCETIATAHLLGVDAFDQPAVEQSKILTKDYIRNYSIS